MLAGNSHAFLDLCRYMMELGLHAQAATMCENFIERSDGDPASDVDLRDAYRIWGDALRETGRYVLSAKAYTIAFKAGDDSAASGLVLSLTWTGLFDGARRAIAATQRRLGPEKNVRALCLHIVSFRHCLFVLSLLCRVSQSAYLRVGGRNIHAVGRATVGFLSERLSCECSCRVSNRCPRRRRQYDPAAAAAAATHRTPLTVAYVSADFNGFAPVGHVCHSLQCAPWLRRNPSANEFAAGSEARPQHAQPAARTYGVCRSVA